MEDKILRCAQNDTAPEIGSTEAAVRSCVSLMAAVMGQREELLAYWCDLYYQVRAAHEREIRAAQEKPEEDPTILRRGDLYPVLRELMRDALKSAEHEVAKERLAKRDIGPSQPAAPAALPDAGRAEDENPEAEDPGRRGGWAAKKKGIRDRLLFARAQGLTYAEMEKTGLVSMSEAAAVVSAGKVPMNVYRRVEAALDTLGK